MLNRTVANHNWVWLWPDCSWCVAPPLCGCGSIYFILFTVYIFSLKRIMTIYSINDNWNNVMFLSSTNSTPDVSTGMSPTFESHTCVSLGVCPCLPVCVPLGLCLSVCVWENLCLGVCVGGRGVAETYLATPPTHKHPPSSPPSFLCICISGGSTVRLIHTYSHMPNMWTSVSLCHQ